MIFGILFLQLSTIYAQQNRTINVIEFKAPITPVTSRYIIRAIEVSEKENSQAIIIKMDTPGGLEDSMRDIIQKILNTKTPVIVYVSPQGARAASAGMLITIASDIAAMAPGTNIGAAHPVSIGGGEQDETMEKKIVNDSVAYARSLAQSKGRSVKFAEDAVKLSASISAEEALKQNVIEIIAKDQAELLNKIDGMKVKNVTLSTSNAPVGSTDMDWRERLLLVLTNPNIAYLLMMLGGLGIFIELQSPGVLVPGVIGVFSIILAFVSFQMIPFNFAGLILIMLALVLFVLEAQIVSYGALTFGGLIALVVGSLLLVDSTGGFAGVSIAIIAPIALLTLACLAFVLKVGLQAQNKKVITGSSGLIGMIGEARTKIAPSGQIFMDGALWQAESKDIIKAGQKVVVEAVEGLRLTVKQLKEQNNE